jgi:hypothetical protein
MATKRRSRGGKKTARRKKPVKGRPTPRRKPARARRKRAEAARRGGRPARSEPITRSATRGLGGEAAGQSGDTEGISRAELADSESVEELLEEGQAFEAGIVSGVENAPDADKGGVRTRQVPEDDVPQEYLDKD